jgi:hypothetical protein
MTNDLTCLQSGRCDREMHHQGYLHVHLRRVKRYHEPEAHSQGINVSLAP